MLNTKKREEWRSKKRMIEEWPQQKDQIVEMRKEIEKLHQQLESQVKDLKQGHKNEVIVGQLYNKGIIDREGNLL